MVSVGFLRSQALARLDYLIERFKTTLPLSGGFNSLPLEGETVALSHMVAHAATIRLHLPSSLDAEESRNKCIFAAKSIASITESMVSANSDKMQLSPIVGVSPLVLYVSSPLTHSRRPGFMDRSM